MIKNNISIPLCVLASLLLSSCGQKRVEGNDMPVADPAQINSSSQPGNKCAADYKNPVIWEDLPDPDVIRVGDTYYYSSSSFHQSPGAPLLRSYDLVHWEYLSHSVPVLDFDSSYDLDGGRAYVNGVWASTLQYRQSNQSFYWMGCMHNVGGGQVFTSKSPQGPWEKHSTKACYYDMGLLIDPDSDDMYVAYGHGDISVAKLAHDGFSEERHQVVFQTPADLSGPLEGSRFYKINGDYYIFTTQYANGEYVARSRNGPFGPYELRPFAVRLPYAGKDAGHSPHQGGIVQTQNGDWYYMAFNDAFPAGRLPVMAPVTWKDGWPKVELIDGSWAASYPRPNLPCAADKVRAPLVHDDFSSSTLNPEWEWNHNPDNKRWSAGNGLALQTATVTRDIYSARNTLTIRTRGPESTATIELEFDEMMDGDVAGLAAWRDSSAWIGLKKEGDAVRVAMVDGISLDKNWQTEGFGTEVASAPLTGQRVWLRVEANIRTSERGGYARFYYSTDGENFSPLGNTFTMKRDWPYFLGYRFAIFNYATKQLGGEVKVVSFDLR